MSSPELRLPCPVCLGVKLGKLAIPAPRPVVLDACGRCGGVWFDLGEVASLKQLRPQALSTRVHLRDRAYSMSCRRCQALFDRNLEACPVCKTKNQIDCPRCAAPLERREAPGLRIDLCRGCRGSWFDNVELAQIWNLRVDAAGKRGLPARSRTTDYFLLESVLLFGDPFLSPLGGAIGSSAGQALAGADLAGVAADAVESTGSLAGSVFETIAHVIGSLFEG